MGDIKMIKGKDIRNKGIKITLDKERILNFDLNAFCELEEIFGDIDKAFKALDSGSMKAIRGLLYAGLKTDDETLTIKKVGSMITMDNIGEISNVIGNALGGSMPEVEEASEDEEEKN